MKGLRRILYTVSLIGLMALTGCSQRTAAAPGAGSDGTMTDGGNQEIHIYSDTQAVSPDTQDDAPATDNGWDIIQDQSFDVNLEGWGKARFVSCKPDDSRDTPHFYLMRDNQVLYTFPWQDRTGTPGVFDSVRFVAFPDLDKDGRKDVIIGVGKVSQNTDSPVPYSVISIYMNRENGFDADEVLSGQVNEAVMYGETDYKQVAALVEEFMKDSTGDEKGLIQQAAGTWKLDGVKTQAGLTQYGSLQEMFGTGLQAGAELKISDSGEISYYIGISAGGTGQCTEAEGSIKTAITPDVDQGNGKENLTLHLISEDDRQYITMEYDGEILYWSR